MRIHFYLITEHPDEDLVGTVRSQHGRAVNGKKNEERRLDKRDINTGETWEERIVGLGYHDFEGEDDFEARSGHVIQQKLDKVDDRHLEKAGLDPQEVGA